MVEIRLATKDDAKAIFAFWAHLAEQDDKFQCSPGRMHATSLDLKQWLSEDSDRSIAIAEEDGEIVCTEVFIPSTAQSVWTNVAPDKFETVYPLICRDASGRCSKNIWGYCGFVPSVKLHCAIGWRDVGDGSIEWVG
jgi:hypothetical protein